MLPLIVPIVSTVARVIIQRAIPFLIKRVAPAAARGLAGFTRVGGKVLLKAARFGGRGAFKVGRVAGRGIAESARRIASIGKSISSNIAKRAISSSIMGKIKDSISDTKKKFESDDKEGTQLEAESRDAEFYRERDDDSAEKRDAIPVEDTNDAEYANKEVNAIRESTTNVDKLQLLKSIAAQSILLRRRLEKVEDYFYKRDQQLEAVRAERKVEGKDAVKVFKDKKDKDKSRTSDALSKFSKIFFGALFAFLPIILDNIDKIKTFLSSLPELIKTQFNILLGNLKETINSLKEYFFDPIRDFFTITIPALWETIKVTMQDALQDFLDVPKVLINGFKQYVNDIIVSSLQEVSNLTKKIPLIGEKLSSALQPVIANRKKAITDLETEAVDYEKARQERKARTFTETFDKKQAEIKKEVEATRKIEQPEQPAAVPEKKAVEPSIEPPKEGEIKPGPNGKFSNSQDFFKAMYPYAKYASEKLGGKIPPKGILGQWAAESGGGRSLPADFNYAGIKAFGKFKKGDYVLTEERYNDAQLERAKKSGETLEKILGKNDKMKKGNRNVTVDEWYGKGAWNAAKASGLNWVQIRSYFAKFSDAKDFTEGYVSILKSPRYARALQASTAADFGLEVAKAGYATASAEAYSNKISGLQAQIAAADVDTGAQIDASSMAAKVTPPKPTAKSPVVVVEQTPPQGKPMQTRSNGFLENPSKNQEEYAKYFAVA